MPSLDLDRTALVLHVRRRRGSSPALQGRLFDGEGVTIPGHFSGRAGLGPGQGKARHRKWLPRPGPARLSGLKFLPKPGPSGVFSVGPLSGRRAFGPGLPKNLQICYPGPARVSSRAAFPLPRPAHRAKKHGPGPRFSGRAGPGLSGRASHAQD
jgi:hypothetical protein